MPAVLLAVATVPAVVNVGVAYLTRNTPASNVQFITYREYLGVSSALLLFVALVAPDVVSPDRRQRVLPIIFARPLLGRDYAVAKIGAIFTCVFLFAWLPQMVLFIGQMLVSDRSLHYLTSTADVLWKVPLAAACLALFYSVIGVAVASLTGRRIVAGATILGITLITSTVSAILVNADSQGFSRQRGHLAVLINVLALPLHVRDLIFLGHIDRGSKLSGVEGGGAMALALFAAWTVGGIAVVLRRYRSAEG